MGFEPTTSSVKGWHSNQLNYWAKYLPPQMLRLKSMNVGLFGGDNRARTYDPLLVRQMLSQLS